MFTSTRLAIATLGTIVAGGLLATVPAQAQRPQQTSNPASAYCVAQGGRLEMRGSTGFCHLPDGRVMEEWAFFREQNDKSRRRDGAIGAPNPAAEHCSAIGGRNVTRRDRNGSEAAYCRLRNGRTVDAFELLRQSDRRSRDGRIGTPNPAAEHCSAIGGRNVTRRDRNGSEAAYCRLRSGRTVDAFELLRQSNRRGAEPEYVTRYCTAQGGRLTRNDDGTHGCHTREGDVFGAQQFYDIRHGKRN